MYKTFYNKRFSRYSVNIDSVPAGNQNACIEDKLNELPRTTFFPFNSRPFVYKSSHDNNIEQFRYGNKDKIFQESENVEAFPLGLPNRSNYCYMNSVLQALRHCHEFVNAVLNYQLDFSHLKLQSNDTDVDLITGFVRLIHDLAYRDKKAVEKSSLIFQNHHDNYPNFANGEQDADEYLQFLLNKLNDVTKIENKRNKSFNLITKRKFSKDSMEAFKIFNDANNSFTTKLFCGQMNNEIKCENCSFKKSSFEVFWVLSVPVIRDNDQISIGDEVTLESCIRSLENFQKVFLNNCPVCKSTDSMYMQTHVTNWPKYLVIHVKRSLDFSLSKKDNTRIEWPLDKLLIVPQHNSNFYRYSLLGVIDHIGSVTNGHYLAKFRDLNDLTCWWSFNDTCVSKVVDLEKKIVTGDTTTYFFQR